jgi:hypothetical protein
VRWRSGLPRLLLAVPGTLLIAQPVAAHAGGLSGVVDPGPVPLWLVVATGGVVVGASFLFSTFITDHEAMRAVAGWRYRLPISTGTRRLMTWLFRLLGLAGLLLVFVTGLLGPSHVTLNAALLIVWVVWWAGFTMSVYLVGNPWPAINPWHSVAALIAGRPRWEYPAWLGAWPSVFGLLGLVWLEVVSPVAEDPGLLVGVIGVYSVVTVVGATAIGSGVWFRNVDPIARVFRVYGALAPLQRTADGLALALPSAALIRQAIPEDPGETAFVVALLWVTTFDGLVATPAWRSVITPIVGLGIPARLVYVVAIGLGFLVFLGGYRSAATWSRRTADTYVAASYLRRWFTPSLVPIAAGYHIAHFLGFFLSLAPVLAAVILAPFDPPSVEPLALPGWFATSQLLFVLGGHLVAVWVAHARSFELFPGVLAPIRSQYPFIILMVFYTMTSMWVVAQPFAQPPYV